VSGAEKECGYKGGGDDTAHVGGVYVDEVAVKWKVRLSTEECCVKR
jgi:hypothetical protein